MSNPADPSTLPRRRLGRTGMEVTALGLGGAGLGSAVSDREAIETVHLAIREGINFVDTSPLYGESERRLGQALAGGLRDRIFLSTKTGTHPRRRGDYSRDATMWSVENSLRLLGTDYLDLLLVHDPNDMTPVFADGGALAALETLKEQGVIRAIGLGQRRHDFHRQAIESGRFDVILTYLDHHPLCTTAADWLLPLAARHDVGVLNGSPLGYGLLVGKDPDDLPPAVRLRTGKPQCAALRRFHQWCLAREVSMIAVALQFSLRSPLIHCTLTGPKNPIELAENLRVVADLLPEEIWNELCAQRLTEGQEQV